MFIVGHLPRWCRGVEHLDVADRHKHNKDANLFEKLAAASRWGVSPWFLNPSDDQLLLKPVHFADCRAFHAGDLAQMSAAFWGRHKWYERLRHTMEHLRSRGYQALHCDTHTPYPIHRDTFLEVFNHLDYASGLGYTIHTLYANSAPLERVPLGRAKATFEHGCDCQNLDFIRKMLDQPGRLFCGYSDAGLTPQLMAEIEARFPDPSPWEADVPGRPRYVPADLIRRVELCGSDWMATFGGLYQGAYCVQQIPGEAAEFLAVAKTDCRPNPRLLEVGSAAGGFARLIDDVLVCRGVTVLDDNQHPNHPQRRNNLPHAAERIGPAGEAGAWLSHRDEQYDLAVIDTSHVYEHERRHTEIVLPRLARGGLLAYHDSVACAGEDQVGRLLREMKGGLYPDVEHLADIGSRLGLCVFKKRGDPPDLAPYAPPPATLLFHFCAWLGRPEMIQFHLRCLRRYLPQFSKVRMNLVTGEGFADAEQLEATLRSCMREGADVKFFRNPHAPAMHGETVPFFRDLLPEVGEEEHVCYGHTKGAMLSPLPGGRVWAELMYAGVMANSRAMIAMLDKHPCVGAFIRNGARGAAWHYSGTYFWFRGVRKFAGWQNFHRSRYGVESWLGRFIPRQQAYETLNWPLLKSVVRNAAGLVDRYLQIPWGSD